MTRRRLLPLAVLLALVLAAAGCGGGDDNNDSKSASTPTQSATQSTTGKSAYQSQVQTILTSVGTAGSTLGTAAGSSKNASDIADALTKFQASVNKAADDLKNLQAPSSAQQGQDELEQVLREIADGVQPAVDAAKEGNRAKFLTTFRAYQAKLQGDYRQRLTAAGAKIDQALAKQ
jgi:hypothetical protein